MSSRTFIKFSKLFLIEILLWLSIIRTPVLAVNKLGFSCPNPESPILNQKNVRGIILPHHQVARPVWNDVFSQLAKQQPIKKVILLSPNHQWLGKQAVITASTPSIQEDWKVDIDRSAISLINQSSWVEDNSSIVWNEHGVTNLIPFIKQNFPTAKVVPIIFTKNVSLKQINILNSQLADSLDQETIVITSLDFVHDATPDKARKNDQYTQFLIESRDYNKLLKLNSHFVDSPAALVLHFKLMDKKNLHSKLIWQAHAGSYYHDCINQTTSYQIWISQ